VDEDFFKPDDDGKDSLDELSEYVFVRLADPSIYDGESPESAELMRDGLAQVRHALWQLRREFRIRVERLRRVRRRSE
jgi:hypothetical protein